MNTLLRNIYVLSKLGCLAVLINVCSSCSCSSQNDMKTADDTDSIPAATDVPVPAADQLSDTTSQADVCSSTHVGLRYAHETVHAQVTPTDSATLTVKDATLTVHRGSVDKKLNLSITPLDSTEIAALPMGMTNVTRGAAGFRFLPHGEHFVNCAAQVVLPYDSILIPKGYTARDIRTYYYDESDGRWTALAKDTTIEASQLAYASTTHFTDMINGILQVPEMPETNGFAPTMMSDVKAADPVTGIISMQAPQAVQSGAATMSYPLPLPAGRNGMQPNVAISYSSEGRSGWCGYGWSLQMPSIDIDTRWGAPRFDEKYETEIYLVNGEQTTLMPHRSVEQISRTAEREFFPRVETAFATIIRHGNSPKNYWWTVTTKDGLRMTYGDTEASRVVNEQGNIVHWALSRTEEVHGDNVTYEYVLRDGHLYPSVICYTNHNDQKGVCRVEFSLCDQNENIRRDISLNCMMGMMQKDNQLLRDIRVYSNDNLIAQYEPVYAIGQIRKTLLTEIVQKDSDGHVVGSHKFGYYNDIADGLFGEARKWHIGNDKALEGSLIDRIGMTDGMSAIGGSRSTGSTIGGGASVGVSPLKVPQLSAQVGGSYSSSKTWSRTYISMMDVDGDGRPDKVFEDDGTLYYRPNTSQGETISFGDKIVIPGAKRLSLSESKSSSKSIDVGLGVNMKKNSRLSISGGWSREKTSTYDWTHSYTSDYNGDGLIDIAEKGKVLFCHVDENGKVSYIDSNEKTPNPVWSKEREAFSEMTDEEYQNEVAAQEKENPLMDAVRLWQAPYDGTVRVVGEVALVNPEKSKDGVVALIQHQNNKTKWKEEVKREIKKHNIEIQVKKGDYIMFRLQSVYSGTADAVKWNPVIEYIKNCKEVNTITRYDENGKDRLLYKASDDFIHAQSPGVLLTETPDWMKQTINKQSTRGNVTLKIISETDDKVLWSRTLNADEECDIKAEEISCDFISDTISIKSQIVSDVPEDLRRIRWSVETQTVEEQNRIIKTLAPEYLTYYGNEMHISRAQTITMPSMPSYEVDENAVVPTSSSIADSWKKGNRKLYDVVYDDKLELSAYVQGVKFADEKVAKSSAFYTLTEKGQTKEVGTLLYASEKALVGKDKSEFATLRIDTLMAGKQILANMYVDSVMTGVGSAQVEMGRWLTRKYSVEYTDTADNNKKYYVEEQEKEFITTAPVEMTVASKESDKGLGHMYRHWGQFAWGESGDEIINVEKVGYKESDGDKMADYSNKTNYTEEEIAGLSDIAESPFVPMTYDGTKERWVSVKDSIFVGLETQCSSRRLESEIVVENFVYNLSGYKMNAMRMRSVSKTESNSYSGSFVVGAGVSKSETNMKSYSSVIDLNGDRYPDWITEKDGKITIKFTEMNGSLGSEVAETDMKLTSSHAVAQGKNLSCSNVLSAATLVKGLLKTDKKSGDAGDAGRLSASVNGSINNNKSVSKNDWIDINGDGLSDMVTDDGTVYLNMGYRFSEQKWNNKFVQNNTSKTKGLGGGFNIPVYKGASISGGTSYSKTENWTSACYMDVDGDGLVDMVYADDDDENNECFVAFNNGLGFDDPIRMNNIMSSGKSVAKVANGNIGVAFGIPIPILFIQINPTISILGSGSTSFSRNERSLMDINGDGVADIVTSTENNEVTVRLGKMGRTNLLRTVEMPLGAKMTVEYDRTANTYDMPQSRWVMTKVTTEGGDKANGATRFANSFEYNNGYYDRRERDFFGFREVISRQLDTDNSDAVFRSTVQEYDNRNYPTRNMVVATTSTTSDGFVFNKSDISYLYRKVHDNVSLFVAQEKSTTTTYEKGSDASMSLSESFVYDKYGNITEYVSSTEEDTYKTRISYHELRDRNIFSRPREVKVEADGNVMRHTTSTVNDRGDMTSITKIADEHKVEFTLDYDQYGNVTKLTGPANASGQRFFRQYAYDKVHHSLPTDITDAFGYHSSTEYDLTWCVPTKVTDMNGNEMTYSYDNRGRLTDIAAPYELDNGKESTIKFEYDDVRHIVKTTNYDSKTKTPILTYAFADNLGRLIQTKKSAVVMENGEDKEVMIVSGTIVSDAMGRKTAEGQPVTESRGKETSINRDAILNATTTEYDDLDRPVKVTLPDNSSSAASYAIVEEDGTAMMKVTNTDANGNVTESYKDVRDRDRMSVQYLGDGGMVKTSMAYNAIGELLTVTHPDGRHTTYKYDKLGQKLSVDHPDAGLTRYKYDNAGNMTARQTANIREVDQEGWIEYTYEFNRLREIMYPKNIYNRVTYTYGGADETKYNRAGRLVLVEDGSGGEEYYYGKMGEVTKTVKTILLSETDIRTYVWETEYDSWNRLHSMTYPDGEKVSYTYDNGGALKSVSAVRNGDTKNLILSQGYDKYGNLVYRKNGNGTETTYTYDDKRLYLKNMTLKSDGSEMMNNDYKYDPIGNILGISNSASPAGSEIGGTYSHTYTYDALSRLISASGKAKDASYTLDMKYDIMGNPLHKEQDLSGCTSGSTSHSFDYSYNDERHPHAPSSVGNKLYTYDANGNPICVADTANETTRMMQWDEENRLMSLGDDGYVSRYTYNHAGERVIKAHGPTTAVFVNGAPQGVFYGDKDNYTLYVSPYMVVSRDRFTKHYYAGTQRIASAIGTGEFTNKMDVTGASLTAGQKNYQQRMNEITQKRNDYYASIGTPPGPATSKGIYGEAEVTGHYASEINGVLGNYDLPTNWPQPVMHNAPGDVPGAPVMYGPAQTPDEIGAGYGYQDAEAKPETDIFYYHSDHLGSTSYITDNEGNATQFVCYMPYGETLVDEHTTVPDPAYLTAYKFNGKEMDAETGLYYYGARYYEPELAMWYGVDALAEKYASMGGYVYCAGNPVRLVDPDGNDPISALVDGTTAFACDLLVNALTDHFLNEKDWSSSFKDNMMGASVAGAKSACVSLIFSGLGSAKALKKATESPLGKVCINTISNFTAAVTTRITNGEFKDIDFTTIDGLKEVFNKVFPDLVSSLSSALVAQGFDKAATNLKGKMDAFQNKMIKQETKLLTLKSEKAIANRLKKVNKSQMDYCGSILEYSLFEMVDQTAECTTYKATEAGCKYISTKIEE